MNDSWLVTPGSAAGIDAIDPSSTAGAPGDKAATEAATESLRKDLVELQERLWAANDASLLIVLQAMDAGGKDGAIRKVFSGVNPQGCRVHSFKAPTGEELEHDFLWRIHQRVPTHGEIVIFNRSHYEDVLVVRARALTDENVWRPRFRIIRDFEHNLAAAGTRIVKIMLHVSAEEQAKRFEARQSDPTKRWKFNPGDLDDAKLRPAFMAAYEEALSETSTAEAPWFVVPADMKWYRNWAVMTIITDALREMNPQYPA